MSFMKYFDHLKLDMKDVASATNNFDPAKLIGLGGFGSVYKGELCSPEGLITAAFKKLDRRLGQGNIEFWKEVMMLSQYKHQNLISLMHYCVEGDDMILVYEYASRGSVDRYLSDDVTLTWIQRLKICLGAARGLHFLHDPKNTQQRVLHRDIKSANILLDENWTAKVSDFGLSKVGPANQAHTFLSSHGVGTFGYCDPLYLELGFLSKESDVYSFGVVLFEILCGRSCTEYKNGVLTKILVPEWRRCYDKKRLDEIILPGLRNQMDPGSLESFSGIAYQCMKKAREDRPTMAEIVKKLESSLKQQEILENRRQGVDFPEHLADDLGSDSDSDLDLDLDSTRGLVQSEASASMFINWQRGELLGRGSLGTVYECFNEFGYFFAVKEFSLLDKGSQGKQSIIQLEHEISLLSRLNHENIVRYLGTDKDDGKLYIFLELVTKGSMAKLYQKYRLRDSQISAYTRQILHGLKYLHEQQVVHRDLKCANILIDATGSVKLADFGLAMAPSLIDTKSSEGPPYWITAPEVVNNRALAADIWSLGCTVLEMFTKKNPYSNLEGMQALFCISRGEPPPIPNTLSAEARDFILKCLQVNPDDRPSAAQLLEHPFLRRRDLINSALAS
ncbi:uncharacterized protein LOC143533415 [Bidens hawaiensis]|uniref:uncharacterized protein LOC143533415 n=1 Tax=Bidens hawaiensis TaxID=980011 RepID=UPI004049A789